MYLTFYLVFFVVVFVYFASNTLPPCIVDLYCCEVYNTGQRYTDCVQTRHVLYLQCLYRHSAGRPVLRYYCSLTKGSECLILIAE